MKFDKKQSLRPSELVLIGDQMLIFFGLASAIFVNYRLLSIIELPLKTILYRAIIHIAFGIIAWTIFRVYKKVIRFFNSHDHLNLIGIILLIHLASIFTGYLLPAKLKLNNEIFVISFFISSIYIIGSRLIISYLYFHYRKGNNQGTQKKLFIYGAGELGVFLKKSICNSPDQDYKIVAFLDDDKKKIGRYIEGIEVRDAGNNLDKLIRKDEITDIIIANKALTPLRKAKFLESILELNVRVREISSYKSLMSSFNMEKLASLDINDLMNREAIKLYDEHVADKLKDKVCLVTGAAGSIGSEIVRKLSKHGAAKIVCVDYSESALYDLQQELQRSFPEINYNFTLADIRDVKMMYEVFEGFNPHFIYHAAAYKHVPLMEQFPWQAVRTNVISTWEIVKLSVLFKAEKFVFISSDKAVNPTSVMGATKRLAEIIVQSFASKNSSTSFAVTRFGNVLGSNGSVVPLFKKQIEQGGPVTVTHPEMTRYFMTIAEACQLVLEASIMAKGGEVFVFDMGKPIKIVDLARNMIRLAGFVPDVDMPIHFIGERPGEKLYEDLFLDSEKMKETYNEKIMISKESDHDMAQAEGIIRKFKALEQYFEPAYYKNAIKELLPEYKYVPSSAEEAISLKQVGSKNELSYQN